MSAAPNPFEPLNVNEGNRSRTQAWIWWISGLLLLATMLNYMDRQTLANLKVRITTELELSNELYGNLEWGFGWSFALGSLFFGYLSDRISVRFLYPAVLLAWSVIGILTGFCDGYKSMLACRILLGFFEAGHWPCALRTTKIVLDSKNRTMGNSILQSGGALGAILTPPVILVIVGDSQVAGAWRSPFIVIGSLGIAWLVAWLFSTRAGDLPVPVVEQGKDDAPDRGFLAECLINRKFWTLVPVVIFINLTWQLIRAWLPAFLQEGRGATERAALLFNSAYYIAADIGCIAAGAGTLWLARRGHAVHRTRLIVFGLCAAMTSLTIVASTLPLGWGLYGVLLIVAAGSLGLFPCYYSLAQETSERHMGKTAGLLGALAWLVSSPMQTVFGKVVDETHSFDKGLALAGIAPILALVALIIWWPRGSAASENIDHVKQA
ncbi:MAG TPA: MFS transporter [Planctomycetaceae bacterium]|nr:MFS transporter [Planctomycetaceae bacterium]HQZ68991.1 MFS transporter [Planctomycetaceae bacterium]